MTGTKKAYLAAAVQIIITGFSFMFVKITLKTLSPIDILMYRFFFAWMVASIPILLKKVQFKITVADIKKIFPLALFYPILFFAFQVFGLTFSSSSEAGIIQATVPIFTIILAGIILKEKTSTLQKMSVLLSIAGIVYISRMNSQDALNFSIIGTILLILSAVSNAFYSVFARKLTKEYSFYTLTYIMTFLGFAIFTIMSFNARIVSGASLDYIAPLKSPSFLIGILYLGVLSSFVSSLLSNYALSKIEASKISVFANLTPVIATLAGVFILNETLKSYHIIGMLVTLVGVIGATAFGNRKNERRGDL